MVPETASVRIGAFLSSITENLTFFMNYYELSGTITLVINCNSAKYAMQ
jgi:hypothetical protein